MSPAVADGIAPGLEVRVDSSPMAPQLAERLVEVRVQDNLTLPDTFLLRIADPDLEEIDSPTLNIGTEIEILLERATAGSLRSVCAGQVAALEPEFASAGAYIVLRGYDHSQTLFRKRRTETYQNVTADDIARKVAGRSNLDTGTIDAAEPSHDFIQQSNETDWDLLWHLASAIDFEVLVLDRKLHFRKAGAYGEEEPVQLQWGENLLAFRPRITGVQQVERVHVRGWDPTNKQAIESTAEPDDISSEVGVSQEEVVGSLGGGEIAVADRPVLTQAEADGLARSVAARVGNQFVEAEGSAEGDPRLRAGAKIAISGVGTRFSGTYTLSSTTHIFRGSSGYDTQFTISGRTPRGLVDLMTPGSKRQWSDGLVVALVTQNEDPDGLGRVRVKYPTLGEENEGWWARIASVSAGEGRGVVMLPVIGEEVLVGFEHGDTRRPYVLGSLFNGTEKPGQLANSDGSFALHSDTAVSIDAGEGVTLKSGQAMSLTSEAEMTLKAEGSLNEQVQSDYSLNADGSITIAADSSVTVEAQGELTISAPQITLQASGVVQISASQVMLG